MKSLLVSDWLVHAVRSATVLALATALFFAWGGVREAEAAAINVLTVDCTPLVSPGIGAFGPTNTMGMALQAVDQGGDFNVIEDTPATFRARNAASLSAFDLIAINNHPVRLGDGCVSGAGSGLGTTWQGVIGVNSGGRVLLTSHDTPRFHMTATPGSGGGLSGGFPGPGIEPYGADELVRQAALWAGGGSQTGLLIFNEGFPAALGWDNPELNLPAAWGISDLPQGQFLDGGYTDILPAFAAHPVYAGLSDSRFGVDSVSSFAANVGDASWHQIFASFDATIFAPTEVVTNSGVVNVGGLLPLGTLLAPTAPDGTAITLIRDEGAAPPPPPPPPPGAPVGGTVELVSGSSAAADAQQSGRGRELGLAAMTIALAGLAGVMGLGWVVRRKRRNTN